MKKRFGFWRRLLVLFTTIVLLAGIYAVMMMTMAGNARSGVEKTKEDLRKQGFKTDLAEFNFSVPASEQAFQLALERLELSGRSQAMAPVTLMRRASQDSAIVTWNETAIQRSDAQSQTDFAHTIYVNDPDFIAARAAAFAEPIRFSLDARQGLEMTLPHLAPMRGLILSCSSEMIDALHNQDRAAAWTNLMASTRLVTQWEPEPTEISHSLRFALASVVYQATWEALQSHEWSDEQLAALQREWEGVNFFQGQSEVVAFRRAAGLERCEQEGKEMTDAFHSAEVLKEMWDSPRDIPRAARDLWSGFQYLYGGRVYEDEKGMLLFFRDREVEVKNAQKAASWQAMRMMPGVTNAPTYISKYRNSVATMITLYQFNSSFARRGSGFWGRAAQAETYRRLILTGISLERFRMRHGRYPAGLEELVPEFLKQPAIDFMDGQPLRYRLGVDGHFVLYSIGLDCVDDGGVIPQVPAARSRAGIAGLMGIQETGDLVWPRPATSNEVVMLHEAELQERRQETEFKQRTASEEYWNRTAARQVRADSSFVRPDSEINGNSFNGRPVSDILRNENIAETNTLTEMLTLRPVITGAEPETITFEAPIKFDALTNVGRLSLLIDQSKNDAPEFGEGSAAQVEISRATNGNCRLAWHTIYETPGRHTLQLALYLDSGTGQQIVAGPIAVMEVTNLCQFSDSSVNFDSETGAWLFAKAPELKVDYSVEIFSAAGKRVRTMAGSTGNGVIEVFWDLLGDDGKKLADQSFSTVWRITLPESRKIQTLKGP